MRYHLDTFHCWLIRRREKAIMWIAWRLPRSVVYWCFIRVFSHATAGPWGNEDPGKTLAMDAMERFAPKGIV